MNIILYQCLGNFFWEPSVNLILYGIMPRNSQFFPLPDALNASTLLMRCVQHIVSLWDRNMPSILPLWTESGNLLHVFPWRHPPWISYNEKNVFPADLEAQIQYFFSLTWKPVSYVWNHFGPPNMSEMPWKASDIASTLDIDPDMLHENESWLRKSLI